MPNDSAQASAPSNNNGQDPAYDDVPIESLFDLPDVDDSDAMDREAETIFQQAIHEEQEEAIRQREVRFAPHVADEPASPSQREPAPTAASSGRVLRDRSTLRKPARYQDTYAHLSAIVPDEATRAMISEVLDWNDEFDREQILPGILAMLSKKTRDPDLPKYKEAMNGPDARWYQKAMGTEWDELDEHDTFDLVP